MELFWPMMALIVPAVIVIFFTRLIHNKYVAVLLTFILFAAAIYQGYFYSEWTLFLNAVSIVIGYMLIELYELDAVDIQDEE